MLDTIILRKKKGLDSFNTNTDEFRRYISTIRSFNFLSLCPIVKSNIIIKIEKSIFKFLIFI